MRRHFGDPRNGVRGFYRPVQGYRLRNGIRKEPRRADRTQKRCGKGKGAYRAGKRVEQISHFPFGDDKEADQIEKTKGDSASQTYDLLNRPTSSDALKQNLRESIVEDSRTLIEDIENLAKSRFKKFCHSRT